MILALAAMTQLAGAAPSWGNPVGGITFADGHAQIRKWIDPIVLHGRVPPTSQTGNLGFVRLPPGNKPPTGLTRLQIASTVAQ